MLFRGWFGKMEMIPGTLVCPTARISRQRAQRSWSAACGCHGALLFISHDPDPTFGRERSREVRPSMSIDPLQLARSHSSHALRWRETPSDCLLIGLSKLQHVVVAPLRSDELQTER